MRRALTIALLSFWLICSSCTRKSSLGRVTNATDKSNEVTDMLDADIPAEYRISRKIGLQNLRQAMSARRVITQITPVAAKGPETPESTGLADPILQTYQETLYPRPVPGEDSITVAFKRGFNLFSLDGDALSISPSYLIAMANLSAAFCESWREREKLIVRNARTVFTDVDFSDVRTFTETVRAAMIRKLYLAILQREESAKEKEILLKAIADSVASSSSDPIGTATLVACTAIMASLEGVTQ